MNSAQLQTFSARAAAVGAALWPAVVLIDGVEYPATLPEPRASAGLITGGEEIEGSLAARVLLTDLPAKPALQQALRWKRPGDAAWNATVWWIDDVDRSPIDAEWRISCVPKN